MKKGIIKISGMHCGSCATTIGMFLSNQAGIKEDKVDFDKGEAVVSYDPEDVNWQEIFKGIKDMGYSAELASE